MNEEELYENLLKNIEQVCNDFQGQQNTFLVRKQLEDKIYEEIRMFYMMGGKLYNNLKHREIELDDIQVITSDDYTYHVEVTIMEKDKENYG